jgi:DNA (cytosine-5)-methyltransferase 1
MSKALVVPLEGRAGDRVNTTSDPLRTQTARHQDAFVTRAEWGGQDWPVSDPHPTLTTYDTASVIEPPPFIAELRGGGSTARPTTEPMSTVTASGNHHGLVTPAGGSWNDDARPTDEAFRALTTRDAYGLVMPYYRTGQVRPTGDAIGTLTTHDRYALIQRHNSSKGEGAEMLTPASEALRTLTTKGHQSLLTPGDITAAEAQVDDCLFRMLEPLEVAAGMAFPADYIWGGTRRERVKLCGNAVTPPSARDLIAAVAESLA